MNILVAYLPGQSTFEMQITSGKFEAELFSMTNATKFEDRNDYELYETELVKLTAAASGTHLIASLSKTATVSSVKIGGANGFEIVNSAQSVTSGTYFPSNTEGATAHCEVMVSEDDFAIGDVLEISYTHAVDASVAEIDNRSSAMGEAVLKYPVYGSGEDCTDSSIIGYVVMHVYRCRVTAQPGLDGSYKSASTFQFTLAAMDAKRADEACYSIAYIKNED